MVDGAAEYVDTHDTKTLEKSSEVINRFIEARFKTSLISEQEFASQDTQEQFQYLNNLQRLGALSVKRPGGRNYEASALGEVQKNTQMYLYDLVGSAHVGIDHFEVLDNLTTPVETTQHGNTGTDTQEHKWFRSDVDINTISSTLESKTQEAIQKGVADLSRREGISIDEAKREYYFSEHGGNLRNIYSRLVSSGILEEEDNPSMETIAKKLSSKEAVLAAMNGKLDENDKEGVFVRAFREAGADTGRREKIIKDLQEVAADMKTVYETVAPLYVDYAQMVLKRMEQTQRPVVFLFRDGQFLRKVVNEVRKNTHSNVAQEQLKEGMLSRTVFSSVDDRRKLVESSDSQLYFLISSNLASENGAGNPALSQLREKLEGLRNKVDAQIGKVGGDLEQAALGKEVALITKQYVEEARKDETIATAYKTKFEERDKRSVDYEAKRGDLNAYLESIGCFDPFVDLADTGVGGSIMHEISKARVDYWDAHSTNPDFVLKLANQYGVAKEEISNNLGLYKEVYSGSQQLSQEQGYVLRTYMLATSREKGDSQQGYLRDDQSGTVFAVVTPGLMSKLGYSQGNVGLVDSPIMELTHIVESRLNGYTEPIREINRSESGGFTTTHGETVQDKNENVTGLVLPKRRKDARLGGVEITGDPGRIALNFAAMRYVMDEVDKATKGALVNSNQQDIEAHTKNAMDTMLKAGPQMRNLLRFKTPTKEGLNEYLATKRT